MPKTKISWSDEALSTLDQILEYVFKKWGINPVLNLLDELEKLISALGNNKQLCPDSKILGLRKCVLSKQTSLVYKVSKSHIEIVTFIDNRRDHQY